MYKILMKKVLGKIFFKYKTIFSSTPFSYKSYFLQKSLNFLILSFIKILKLSDLTIVGQYNYFLVIHYYTFLSMLPKKFLIKFTSSEMASKSDFSI